jgi:hypothetical protein
MLLERLPGGAGRWMIGALPRPEEGPALASIGLTTAESDRKGTPTRALARAAARAGAESPAPVLPRQNHIEMGATL